jgi:hypothetical protein
MRKPKLLLFQKLSAERTSTYPDCKIMYLRVPGCYRDSLLTAMFGSIHRITRSSPLIDSKTPEQTARHEE